MNAGAITTLINMGTIVGGNGGAFGGGLGNTAAGVAGGDGIENSGAITTLKNGGAIWGGDASGLRQRGRRRRRSQRRDDQDADQQRRDKRGRGVALNGARRGRRRKQFRQIAKLAT